MARRRRKKMSTSDCAHQSDGELMQTKQRQTRRIRRPQLQSGFECIFVKDPPEHLQTECSICLCVLREPYLLDCCGYSFCKSCIEPIKAERKPCPLCAVQFTRYMPDKRLQRTLNDLQVYCAHKDEGCEWVGWLANIAEHLNVNPLLERKRLSGCQLTSLECNHCRECFQRRELLNHETSVCTQRPYSCEYCRDFNSTFKDVTSNHLSVCPDRPVPCPNGCGSSLELKLLDNHLKECPLEVIECPFSYSGCSEKLPRKDMPKHLTEDVALHLNLQTTHHIHELKKLNKRMSELETQLNEARVEVVDLRTENQLLLGKVQQECKVQVTTVGQDMKYAQDQRLKGHLGTLRGEIKKAQVETKQEIAKQVHSDIHGQVQEIKKSQVEITKQIKSDFATLHSHIGLVPCNITMPSFIQKKYSNEPWYSPSFYTHPHGYKMCLRVNANGYGAGENSHVSVFVYMMKGEYDDDLKWPFRGDITIQLLNQMRDDEADLTRVLDVAYDDDFGDRVLEGERSVNGLGFQTFIRHTNLIPSCMKANSLKLCIKEIKFVRPRT